MTSRLFCLLLAVLAISQTAGTKKKPEVTVRFYAQTSATNGAPFATEVPRADGQGTLFISKVPTVSERDILSFYPFQNQDGSVGTYFQLDEHGKFLLDTLSMEQRGQYLAVVVNGRHVIDLLIDQRINDGLAVIPKGLTPEEIGLLRSKFKITGETKSRKR